MLIASAAATLIVTGAAGLGAEERQSQKSPADQVMCEGINECAGKGSCAGSHGGCAGLNSCKGKGMVSATLKDCVCKGGKVVEDPPRTN